MSWSKASVTEVLNTILRSLVEEAQTISPNFEQEIIHQFRVETKRLRALLRLIETEQPESDIKLSKSFKKLYSLAGSIRDAQVQLGRATKQCDPPLPGYTVWLAQEMADAETDFNAFYEPKILKKVAKKLRKLDVPHISQETLALFFKERVDETVLLLQQDPLEDEDLHTVRKRVKDLQHTARLCAEHWPEGLAALGNAASLETLEKLTDLAGEYNDQHVALLSLERYIEQAEKTKKAEQVHQQWTEAQEADRAKLLDAINEFNGSKSKQKRKTTNSRKGQKPTAD